jgi:methionyl aminopeptidase
MYTRIKTSEEIAAMRTSGHMLATVLAELRKVASPGMSTKDLAEVAKLELRKLGGQPAFLGYQGFPDVLCVSVNDEVVHGIPSKNKILANGDILSMDFGVTYKGMITDGAISMVVGKGTKKDYQLVDTTEASLNAAIEIMKAGVRVGDIGHAVQSMLRPSNYGIVRDLVGHGVGHALHEEPNIANFGKKNTGETLQAGMTVAVEPMATLGDHAVVTDHDGWTIRTKDGSRSAHFEHTILITENGAEVLTAIKH